MPNHAIPCVLYLSLTVDTKRLKSRGPCSNWEKERIHHLQQQLQLQMQMQQARWTTRTKQEHETTAASGEAADREMEAQRQELQNVAVRLEED